MTQTPETMPTLDITAPAPLAEMRGLHAGLIVLVGVAVANAGNYAFHLLAAHLLGPSDYGSAVSLLTLSGLISLPLAGVQIGIARAVAGHEARGDSAAVGRVLTRGLVLALLAGTALGLLMIALLPAIEELLDVQSASAILLTAAMTVPALAMPIIWGVVQGLQRYKLLAASLAAGTVLKTVLFLALFAVGGRLTGAIFATLVAGAAAVAGTFWPIRAHAGRPGAMFAGLRGGLTELLPVVGGLLAMTSLTSIDVIVAKTVFSSHDAGVYAGASLIGRVVLYLPAAISTVLLPKVAARAHANRDTTDIVGASIAVTAAVCLTMTALYAIAPNPLARAVLGADFSEAGSLLTRFGLAMTLFAVLNVLLVYHLGHRSARMTALLGVGAVAQLVGYLLFHDSGRDLLNVSIAVGLIVLVLHEVLIARSTLFVFRWLTAFGRLTLGRRA